MAERREVVQRIVMAVDHPTYGFTYVQAWTPEEADQASTFFEEQTHPLTGEYGAMSAWLIHQTEEHTFRERTLRTIERVSNEATA